MDWFWYCAARQYALEEHVGTLVREAKRAEDAQFKAAAKNIRENRT